HVAEGVVVAVARRPRVLTHEPVELHRGVALRGVPLHARAHDVAHGLVDAARLAPVDETGGALGEAVGDLVARDVQRGQGTGGAAVAVAVVHRPSIPERVHVVGADV